MLGRLRFIRSGEDGTMMLQAVDAVRQRGVEPVRLEGGELAGASRGCIYVLESFDTAEYKALAGKCRVIGPAVVLAHLEHDWPMPASTQPVFSMAMHGVYACFTQTGNKDRREALSTTIKQMGGRVTADFTRQVTHLVAGQVGSTKYNVARDLGVPVMRPSWVEACWEEGFTRLVSSTEEGMLSSHRCLPFTGCTITVTGLEEALRKNVGEVCRGNGGVYSGELTKDVCTHLLVGNTASTKYKFARQWHIFCVTPQWFHDSVERGYCLDEKEYDAESPEGAGHRGKQQRRGGEEAPEWAQELEDFQIPAVSETYFLDGCKIYFSGFSDEQLEKLHKMVNLGGGVRYTHVSDNLSHVVMGSKEGGEVAAIQQLAHRPQVVSPLWLLACCSRGERVGEDEYSTLPVSLPQPSPMKTAGGRKRKMEVSSGSGHPSKKARVKEEPMGMEHEGEGEQDLLLQYQTAELPAPPSPGQTGVLTGKEVSISTQFSPDDQRVASKVIGTHGGQIVPGGGDYHVVPLELTGAETDRSPDIPAVTLIWLRRSIEAGALLDPASYFLFCPMTTPILETTLTDCVLAFSQFSDLEREHLIRFSRGLGAIVQDHFARQPSHGMLATTHIILKHPSGEKYECALKWGIPAVTDSWLFACAVAGKLVPVEGHTVGSVRDEPEHEEPGGGGDEGVKKQTGGREPVERSVVRGDGVEKTKETPLKPFKPQFDLKDAMEMIPPYSPSANSQFAAKFTENLGVALATVLQAEEVATEKGSVLRGVRLCVSKKLASQKAHLHNLAGTLGAEYRWAFDDTCTHYVYQGKASDAAKDREVRVAREKGCAVVSPHWITACVESGTRVEEKEFPHTYNPSMALSGLRLHRPPSSQARPLQEEEEEDGPPPDPLQTSANDHHSLEVEEKAPPTHPEPAMPEAPPTEPDPEPTNHEVPPPQAPESGNGCREESRTAEVARMFQKQLEEIKDAPREQMRRRRSKRLLKKDEETSLPLRPPSRTGRNRRGRRGRKEEELTESQVSDSQILQVTYDDPEGRMKKERLLAQIEMEEEMKRRGLDPSLCRRADEITAAVQGAKPATESEEEEEEKVSASNRTILPNVAPAIAHPLCRAQTRPNPQQTDDGARQVAGPTDRDLPSSTPAPPPLNVPIVTRGKASSEVKSLYDERSAQARVTAKPPPRFLLSSLEPREKVDYGALIQELGGQYIDLDYFTTKCTHLVVGKASRTEKYLGACAAGKWVLHKSYLEACRAARRFIEEDEHEWGAGHRSGEGRGEVLPLEAAPRQWRLTLAQRRNGSEGGSTGAFQDWKVLLFAERNKVPGMKRLLEAGGAVVLQNSKLSSTTVKDVSHAFITITHFPRDTLSLEDLVSNGVHCLKPDYIAEYLSKGSGVSLESSYIPEAKELIHR